MSYAILDTEAGDYLRAVTGIITYTDGKEAANAAGLLNKARGKACYQVRRYTALDDNWRTRESNRFATGEYISPLYTIRCHCVPSHWVHVSVKDPSKLAYTACAADGMADRQKQISVAGYLEMFAPAVSASERRKLQALHIAHFAASEVKLAWKPDEIEYVYTHYDDSCSGLDASCMRYETGDFDGNPDCHPTHIYGAGDLAIAYLANEDHETIARALCWPEKKLYTRVYGSCSTVQRLQDLLKLQGYRKSSGYYRNDGCGETLAGARVLRIECEEYDDVYISPYCDDCNYMAKTGDPKYFKLSATAGYSMRETCGLTDSSPDTYRCERCSSRMSEDESFTVYVGWHSTEQWCEDCEGNHAFYCRGYEETYSEDYQDCVQLSGETYSRRYAENHFEYCEQCEEWHDGKSFEVETADSATNMCVSCAQDNAFHDRIDGNYYHNSLLAPDLECGDTDDNGIPYGICFDNAAQYEAEKETLEPAPYHCTDPAQMSLPLRDEETVKSEVRQALTSAGITVVNF